MIMDVRNLGFGCLCQTFDKTDGNHADSQSANYTAKTIFFAQETPARKGHRAFTSHANSSWRMNAIGNPSIVSGKSPADIFATYRPAYSPPTQQ